MNTATALQLLSGSKLHVLVALVALDVAGKLPCGEKDVAVMVGLNRKTTRNYLNQLEALGFAARDGRYASWRLTDGTYQLPLPFLQLEGGRRMIEGVRGKSYPSLPSSPSSSLNVESGERLEEEEGKAEGKGNSYPSQDGGKGRGFGSRRYEVGRKRARKRGLVPALQEAGIGMNMWEELAGYGWVTADYVRAHAAKCRRDGEPIGYAIQRMRSREPMPVVAEEESGCAVCGSERFWIDGVCLRCKGLVQW